MIVTRHVIDRELELMRVLTRTLKRGSLITHAEIEAATGFKRDAAPWPKLIKQWKVWAMDELKIALKSEPGIGYRLCTEQEQIEVALRLERQGVKRVVKAGMTAGVVDPATLSAPLAALQSDVVAASVKVKSDHNVRISERKSLLSRQESMPRIELVGVR